MAEGIEILEPDKDFPLHEGIFNNDIKRVSQLLRIHDVGQKDPHGNTPLHLAVMLGRKDIVHLLLAHGAPVKVKNIQGWTPLAEAISYGDRQTIFSLLKKLKQQSREALDDRRPALIQALRNIGDFYLELKWDFQSWVPLVSRILPSDLCRIHKKGACIRMCTPSSTDFGIPQLPLLIKQLKWQSTEFEKCNHMIVTGFNLIRKKAELDTTLVDFNDMHWERGDITFIFDGEAPPNESLTVLDNKLKVYQRIRHEETDAELDEEIDILMRSDIMAAQMSTKTITFTRAQSGWFFREDKTEMIGDYEAEFYAVNNLILESKKRREHLSQEDLQKNKVMMENLSKGAWDNKEFERRESLPPPTLADVTWEEYISARPGKSPYLGRQWISKESFKAFKATIAMGGLDSEVVESNQNVNVIRMQVNTIHKNVFHCQWTLVRYALWLRFTLEEGKDFPMTVDVVYLRLLDVLEVIAPFKQFQKLREFMMNKLPPGFPVKIEIPVFPTVTAKITFNFFEWRTDLPDKLFIVPRNYREDPNRFPDL